MSRNPVVPAHMSSAGPTRGAADRHPELRRRGASACRALENASASSLIPCWVASPSEATSQPSKKKKVWWQSWYPSCTAARSILAAMRLALRKRAGIDGQLVAPFTNFERSFTGRNTLTPPGVNAEVVFDTAETFFERAGHGGGNSAGVPVETEDTAECLEPERIGQATQQLHGTAIENDVCGDFARKSPLARGRDATEGWRSRVGSPSDPTRQCCPDGPLSRTVLDGPSKELRISAATVCNDGPGFWIQSKVPDELSVNQASRVGLSRH
jgi:hypothetical protein